VDDEAPLRTLAERALRAQGYTVYSAANGVEALKMMEGNNLRPDILVTDIVMPQMRGPALATEVRRRIPAVRIMFVTGYNEDVLQGDDFSGAYRILQKPFAPRDLLRGVRDALDAAV
jgi:two-component system cell cycle sensor histidine kinase/response regulator CckA